MHSKFSIILFGLTYFIWLTFSINGSADFNVLSFISVIASFSAIFDTKAMYRILFFVAVSSILYLSIPGPPIAAPTPSAISPVFSPSNLRAASIVIINLISLLFSITFLIASPGLPTFPPGPFALIKKICLSSIDVSFTIVFFTISF